MIISFDIGGTFIKYGLIDKNHNILYKNIIDTNAQLGGISIINRVIQVIEKAKKEFLIKGVAISSTGVIDYENGIVLSSTNTIPDYIGLNIKKIIEKETNLYTTVENDVNCVALAESNILPPHYNQILFMTIGTGIGGAIIVNHKLYHGHTMSAGEWGNTIFNGQPLENQASLSAIILAAQKQGLNIKNGIELFNLYDQGNKIAVSIITNFYHILSIAICNLVYIFNPDLIVIGGGISNRGLKFSNELSQVLKTHMPKFYASSFELKLTKNLNDSGMIGAFLHHLNQVKRLTES